MQTQSRASGSGAWAAFLAMAFAIVGLAGIFATFAAPLPLQRALARETTLDQVLAAAGAPDADQALAAFRPALGDSADAVLTGTGDLAGRVARERVAMRHRLSVEAAEVGLRLRVMIGIFTIAGALFGIAVLSIVRRTQWASRPPGA